MDIFVRNVPPQATSKQLERFFKAPLEECGVKVFYVEKFEGKQFARLTILDIAAGRMFLERFGVPQESGLRVRAKRPLKLNAQYLQCSPSRSPSSGFSLKSLELEAKQQQQQQQQQRAGTAGASRDATATQNGKITRFDISDIQCGTWDYAGTELVFISHWRGPMRGSITIGDREVAILLEDPGLDQKRIDFNFHSCESIVIDPDIDPSLSFTLKFAPKFYQVPSILDKLDNLSVRATALLLGPAAARAKSGKKSRLLSIDNAHAKVASTCFVYRVQLTKQSMLGVRSLIGNNPRQPPTVTMKADTVPPLETLGRSKERLETALRDPRGLGGKDLKLRFQIDRLVRNGLQSPLRVLELLPKMSQLEAKYGLNATLYALKEFSKQAPYPGPDTEAFEVSRQSNEQLLEQYAERYNPLSPDNPYEL
ncbi:hypothetical protein KC317_g21005, partial [Hortaea werneckii]